MILLSLFFITPVFAEPVVLEKLSASVNNQIVLLSDVQKFKKTLPLRAQLDPLFANSQIGKKDHNPTVAEIVDFLIEETLISQEFPMTDEDVEQEINTIQANNKISRDQLKQAIVQQGFAFRDYFELIRIGASKRNLLDREIRTKVSVSDDEIKNYYMSHHSKSTAPQLVYKVRWIFASQQKTIESALFEIKNKRSSFSEAAKKYSEDSSSSPKGGDLGEMSESQISPLIKKNIRGISIGQVSPILGDSKSGFFIFTVDNKFTSHEAGLKIHADEIRARLTSAEFTKQIRFWLERKKQSAFISTASQN